MKKCFLFGLFLAFFVFLQSPDLCSRDLNPDKLQKISNSEVEAQQRVQRRWNGNFCLTNWGFSGSQIRDFFETPGCLFCDHPDDIWYNAESFEFPSGSELEYLFMGSIWIGGIVNQETLVTVGCDGWFLIREMAPEAGSGGNIFESEGPYGDQECISVYYDTAVPPPLTQTPVEQDFDGRPHMPLGLEIIQHSYSWESPPYDDFVILEYWLKNIGTDTIHQSYVGFFMDTDIMHLDEDPYSVEEGAHDDLTGFLKEFETSPGETTEVNIAWAADNDGQPDKHTGIFTEKSPAGVIGLKLLDCSNPNPELSYNWWISNSDGYPEDWGPWLDSNQTIWDSINPYGSNGYFPDNVLGTPGGDRSKYFVLSNQETDYDQIYCALDHTSDGWLPPTAPSVAEDFVEGYDTRYLVYFGPFDIPTDDSIFVVVAVVAGDGFHTDPLNRLNLPDNPDVYYQNLNFSDLVQNALKAEEVYQSGYTLPPPGPPYNFRVEVISELAVRFLWSPKSYYNLKGYNIYRSTTSGDTTSPPLNTVILTDTVYEDVHLSPSQIYYYTITCVDNDDREGTRSNEIPILPGRPSPPVGVEAEAQKSQVSLVWNQNSEPDLQGYKIYRIRSYDSLFQLVDSIKTDTTYVDNIVENGVVHYYQVTAFDTMGLESYPSDSAYALPMAFDLGIGLADKTDNELCHYQDIDDSVNAFYQRALSGYDYFRIEYNYLPIDLKDLNHFPVIILHSENICTQRDSTITVLEHYLNAGGKLIFSGRNNSILLFCVYGSYDWYGMLDLCSGQTYGDLSQFPCDYLKMEEICLPNWHPSQYYIGNAEFKGAFSNIPGYPDLEVDSARVDMNWLEFLMLPQGKLPGVGYFTTKDTSTLPLDIIYTFNSYQDTSERQGKPVGYRYLGDDYQFVFFDFPLYFIEEEEATQVLHKALEDLGIEPISVEFLCGDINNDGLINLTDVIHLANFILKGGEPPSSPICRANANGDHTIDLLDVIFLANYLFKGGPEPHDCMNYK